MAFTRRLVAAVLASLVLAPAAHAAPDPDPVGRNEQQFCRLDGRCAGPDLAAYEGSWVHHALASQSALSDGIAFRDAPWVGTHNSFNSIVEMGPALSPLDANQRMTIVEQLESDARAIEIDVHDFRGAPVVCHATGVAGCTVEREVGSVLAPVAAWLRAHPREVILLYLEDQLGDAASHDAAVAQIRAQIGDRIDAPTGGGCQDLPLDRTRDDVRAAGKQVVIVSGGCGKGSWPSIAHTWSTHVEDRPHAFVGKPTCGPGAKPADYARTIVRFFEDSTQVSAATGEPDDGLTPATTTAMVHCGVDLFGFDQLTPTDGRLEALAWSWAPHEPRAGADAGCAVQRPADGRWVARTCGVRHRVACRRGDGTWLVLRHGVRRSRAVAACRLQGARFDVPRTAVDNDALHAATPAGAPVWIAAPA